jgi:hypothetical protein
VPTPRCRYLFNPSPDEKYRRGWENASGLVYGEAHRLQSVDLGANTENPLRGLRRYPSSRGPVRPLTAASTRAAISGFSKRTDTSPREGE